MAVAAAGCGGAVTHKATSRVHFYGDERLSVISPSIRDEVQVHKTRIAADYAVDAVSGATQALTVDAVSSATSFSERRHQVGLSGAQALSPETELAAGYALSAEPDHVVHAPSATYTRGLMGDMARVSARYQLQIESIGRVDDTSFSEHALGHRLDLGWTQIATKSISITGLMTATAYGCDQGLGCFANPYRYIGVAQAGAGSVAVIERHPDSRYTGAAALRAAWAFSDVGALHAGYRFAVDSWEISAHTVDTALATELYHRLLVRAEARATVQGAASFYSARYSAEPGTVPAFRTADAELSELWNFKSQLHLEWAFRRLRLVGEIGRMWNQYPDFPSLTSRHAWIGGIGVDADL
jgi:hypothetical protein